MQYSYEQWANREPEPEISIPENSGEVDAAFPFSEDLKELEAGLSLGLTEGLDAYRDYQHAQDEELQGFPLEAHAGADSGWDDLARIVAEHVMESMREGPLQAEVEALRAQVDELYDDNLAMAEHVQQLMDESEQLRQSVSACELELARYRHLMGNLYLKV